MTPTTIFATTPTTPTIRSRVGRSGRSAAATTTTTRAVRLPAASRTVALLSEASAAVVFMAATAMPAMADEAVSASAEISPFAGVVDVSVLALLAYFAKLGNEKAAREAQSKTKTSRSKRK